MARAISGDILDGFFKEVPQVLNARFKATVAIGMIRESLAKGHGVAAVPRIINERINNPLHAGQATTVVHQFTLSSDSPRLADAHFIGKIAADG